MRSLAGTFLIVTVVAQRRPPCNTYTSCDDCASAGSWVAGANCRYCPTDNQCHEVGSNFDPCWTWESIGNPEHCTAQPPSPPPVPVPADDSDANEHVNAILGELFSWQAVKGFDPSACVDNVGGADISFMNFERHFRSNQTRRALRDLTFALGALSTAMTPCNTPRARHQLDSLSTAVRWAELGENGEVSINGRDMQIDFRLLGDAIAGDDWAEVGRRIVVFFDNWSGMPWGAACPDDNKECMIIDAIMCGLSFRSPTQGRVLGCERAFMPIFGEFLDGASKIRSGEGDQITAAIGIFAQALRDLATAGEAGDCGLSIMSSAARGVGDALSLASIHINHDVTCCESNTTDWRCAAYSFDDGLGRCSGGDWGLACGDEGSCIDKAIEITVGSVDVSEELFAFAANLIDGDHYGAGLNLVRLLSALRASHCESQACLVVENMMPFLALGFVDLSTCRDGLDQSWSALMDSYSALRSMHWRSAMTHLGEAFAQFARGVAGCAPVGPIFQRVADLFGGHGSATVIGEMTQMLVGGADVSLDFAQLITDMDHADWDAAGKDLGGLSVRLTETECDSFVCELVEGILGEVGQVMIDLAPCRAELQEVEQSFTAGAALWQEGKAATAVGFLSAGLSHVAASVGKCDLEHHMHFIVQEANLLGLGDITILDEMTQVVIHGADFHGLLHDTCEDMEHHDYLAAGAKMALAMDQLAEWTGRHLCISPVCYAMSGALQFFGDIVDDPVTCAHDFRDVEGNFTAGFEALVEVEVWPIQFHSNREMIQEGIHKFAAGFGALADLVYDCHLDELRYIMRAIALHLSFGAEITWVLGVLTVVIHGIEITRELVDIAEAYMGNNWPAFGYHFARLVRIIPSEELQAFKGAFKANNKLMVPELPAVDIVV